MKVAYLPLAVVTLAHAYYGQGEGRAFEVEPTAATQRLLKRYGMLFKKQGSGFVLLNEAYESQPNTYTFLRPIEEAAVFSFALRSAHPELTQYLRLSGQPTFFYFHNLRQERDDAALLSGDAFAGLADRVQLLPQNTTLQWSAGAARQTLLLEDALGQVTTFESMGQQDGISYQHCLNLDLQIGFYTASFADGSKRAFYAGNDAFSNADFGVIDLHVDPSFHAANRSLDGSGQPFLNGGQAVPAHFKIAVATPQTIWRYWVISRQDNLDPNNLRIKADGLSFGEAQTDATSGRITIESLDPVQIHNTPLTGLSLQKRVGDENNTWVDLIEDLPNPTLGALASRVGDPTHYYSDVFVYV